ncbi:MAG: CDP-alcohol phosphatidyltransferase family protein [Candidatus Gastranaerophilales bacterium]|nr:CDP-alcohol phosphatidyltransferase family protein [Candidatus Gastranaerophilales bacterium]
MANLISIFRAILAIIVISILFIKNPTVYWTAFILTIVVIWMDGLDGYVARKFNECSKFGAVLDIIGDRIVENVYWIAFLALGWLPVWIPLVVVVRGLVTDGLRSVALEQGFTAFGSSTMMESKIGKFIVASNFSRFSYAFFKAVAFALLIAAHVPQEYPYHNIISSIAYASAYIAVFFCIVRGLPVIIESKRFFPSKND